MSCRKVNKIISRADIVILLFSFVIALAQLIQKALRKFSLLSKSRTLHRGTEQRNWANKTQITAQVTFWYCEWHCVIMVLMYIKVLMNHCCICSTNFKTVNNTVISCIFLKGGSVRSLTTCSACILHKPHIQNVYAFSVMHYLMSKPAESGLSEK